MRVIGASDGLWEPLVTKEKAKPIVAIEARIADPATAGGIGQVIMSLAKNLSELEDAPHDYVFVGLANARDWLEKYIGGACRLHMPPVARSPLQPFLDKYWKFRYEWLTKLQSSSIIPVEQLLPRSDGAIEALGAAAVHFPLQTAYLTKVPSIYQPHDLQHLHMPEFFDANTLRLRLVAYRAYCAQASSVCVETKWISDDVVHKLDVPPEKMSVIVAAPPPLPPVPPDSDVARRARQKAGFDRFVFYPAQTWRHKNHIRLIEALALLKQRYGLVVPLVCSGKKNDFFPEIQNRIYALGVADQVRFIGFVDDSELSALYRLADAVVVPTKFESLSLPVWEAFTAGVAVACSRVTSLPEQVGDAALLFDPDDTEDIAATVRRLWENEALRAELVRKGTARVANLSAAEMGRQFRDLYDRVVNGVIRFDRAAARA